MKRRNLIAVLCGFALVGLAVPAFAATLGVSSSRLTAWNSATSATCTGSTQTLSASADAWVDQASPLANAGAGAINRVRARNAANQRTLTHFTLPAIPANCSVTAARLRLYAAASATGRTIQALRAATTWTETTVTWTTQPATTGAAVTATSGTGYREWVVTAHVQAMYSGSNFGWVIRDATEGGGTARDQQYHARENASNNPQLVVTFG